MFIIDKENESNISNTKENKKVNLKKDKKKPAKQKDKSISEDKMSK